MSKTYADNMKTEGQRHLQSMAVEAFSPSLSPCSRNGSVVTIMD